MSTRDHAPSRFVATLFAVITSATSAGAASPAPHVPTPVAAPDNKPTVAPARLAPVQPVPASASASVGKGAAVSTLPARLDLNARRGRGAVQPAARSVAPRKVVFAPGQFLDGAIETLIEGANATGIPHTGTFNGEVLVAHPGDLRATVRKPLDDAMEAGRKKHEAQLAEAEKVRTQKIAAFTKPLVRTPPSGMKLDPRGKRGDSLALITAAQLKELPQGTVLRTVHGGEAIVGIDDIDDDTGGEFLAVGFDSTATPGK